jgi:hypothetical protein
MSVGALTPAGVFRLLASSAGLANKEIAFSLWHTMVLPAFQVSRILCPSLLLGGNASPMRKNLSTWFSKLTGNANS